MRSYLLLLSPLLLVGCSSYGWAERPEEVGAQTLSVTAITAPPQSGMDTTSLRLELLSELEHAGVLSVAYGAANKLSCQFLSLDSASTESLAGYSLSLTCQLFLHDDPQPLLLEAQAIGLRPLAGPHCGSTAPATNQAIQDAGRSALGQILPEVLLHLQD